VNVDISNAVFVTYKSIFRQELLLILPFNPKLRIAGIKQLSSILILNMVIVIRLQEDRNHF
jgi:hypothetical protein